MTTTLRSKTWSVSLPRDPQAAFSWLAEADNLPHWQGSLCRSVTKKEGAFIVESPEGPVGARMIRDDRALLLDLVLTFPAAAMTLAMRVLPNGQGSEVVLTLVQPGGFDDRAFEEHARWAERAVRDLPQNLSAPASHDVPATEAMALPPEAPVDAPTSGRKLYIGNLPFSWTDEQLRGQFADQGTVLTAEIARFRGRGRSGRSRGFGFVEMETEEQAQAAIQKLHGSLAGERKIVVRLARSQENRPAGENPATDGTASSTALENAPATADDVAAPRGHVAQRPPARRNAPPPRHRSGNARPRRGSPASPRTGTPRRETGISNTSGYEIFPRRKGGFEAEPTARSAAPRPAIEASPYFDDTGDIENRGNRPPGRRRRR